jgi:Na+-transporting NADH:ubiquinone oxidoreductase subunit C
VQYSNAYTFRFAAMVTIVCSVLLAGAATILKPRQEENKILDKKKNVLASVGIKPEEGQSFSRDDIIDLYKERIKEIVIDRDGNIVEGKKPVDLDPRADTDLLPLYENIEDGQIISYIIPVSGKGLWSTIYGYLALDADGQTVRGITFYSHGETPGLGGEIEKDWFTSNFVGKKITDDSGTIVSIEVIKGKVNSDDPQAIHKVDGISGATITAKGVENFIKRDLITYEPFLRQVMQTEGGIDG